jgi:hypothetical protein
MISTLPPARVAEPSFTAEPPPKRFCAAAKEAWASVPEAVSPHEWATKLLGHAPDADATAEMVTKFAAAHPRFEELSEDIAFFLDTGRANDVAEAYKLAERINPAPSEANEVDGGERAN